MMFRLLSEEVKRLRIKIIDHHQVITLLTAKDGSKVIGALAINTREKVIAKSFVLFNAINIVMGTGGPGDIYESTVYPASQAGSTGGQRRNG
jgi:succinate dehydrogenase/fumarate reductase flavoprotein subunit